MYDKLHRLLIFKTSLLCETQCLLHETQCNKTVTQRTTEDAQRTTEKQPLYYLFCKKNYAICHTP